jgi:hypothetical protein
LDVLGVAGDGVVRGYVVEVEDLVQRTSELAMWFATRRASVVLVASLDSVLVRSVRCLANVGVHAEVIIRGAESMASVLECISRRRRVLGSVTHLLSTLLPSELDQAQTVVAAAIVASCRPRTSRELSAGLGISGTVLRSRFDAAGWPTPAYSLLWLQSMHALWACCEHDYTVVQLAREWERVPEDRLRKRIRRTTGRSLRDWQRGGGFWAAAEEMKKRLKRRQFGLLGDEMGVF